MESYDRQEEQFNTRYQEHFVRNILGEYEPGTMEIFQEAQENRMEELGRERLKMKKALEMAEADGHAGGADPQEGHAGAAEPDTEPV